jgi:nucleoside-diphosphate-sugar epimerase
MKVLFIGGTGVISSACAELCVARGVELTLLARGQSSRPAPAGAIVLRGDIRDTAATREILGHQEFDAVVDWVAFKPEHIAADLALFRGRVGQYVFISSASVYQKPPAILPVTESAPLGNPVWQYSRDKIACEERLVQAYRDERFPITIVRPGHTYDPTMVPLPGRYTPVHRLRTGRKAIIHGDGTSVWTLTHHRDFARGLVGLLGASRAIGEAFHITSDELLTWNQIFEIVARAAKAPANFIHIPSDFCAAFEPELAGTLLGDKAHSLIFDNSKIKRVVPDFRAEIPFSRGAAEIMAWYDADPARRVVNERLDAAMDRIVAAYEAAWPR